MEKQKFSFNPGRKAKGTNTPESCPPIPEACEVAPQVKVPVAQHGNLKAKIAERKK